MLQAKPSDTTGGFVYPLIPILTARHQEYCNSSHRTILFCCKQVQTFEVPAGMLLPIISGSRYAARAGSHSNFMFDFTVVNYILISIDFARFCT